MKKPFLVIIGIVVIIAMGFYFNWPAITQGWPFLIFLLCPLMHLFMGHDHGGGNGHEKHHHASEKQKKDGGSCH